MSDQPRLYSTAEVAGRLGISPARVRQLARAAHATGQGIGRRLGRDWLFTDADVTALERRNTQRGPIPRSRLDRVP